MREALAGLTVRGRAFLAAGVTAIACAFVLGEPALSRVGVLLVALPLVTALMVGRTRYRLSLVRSLSNRVVGTGQPARVDLTLTNEGRTPSGVLLLEDRLPYTLGTRPRFVLEGIGHGWSRRTTYQVRSDVRGRFEIGPMSVRVTDPFGLVELGRTFTASAALTVTPRTVPLSPIGLGTGWNGSGEHRSRSFATGSAEDLTVREYRQGDDLRRVHWRSSARTGELMVRREEQPWQSRATVFVDNRIIAHRGIGPASSLEAAVVAAASVTAHLVQRGYTVRLVTANGEDHATAWTTLEGGRESRRLMESLAVLSAVPAVRLDTGWLRENASSGVTVAVLGALEPADGPVLQRIRAHTGLALALALDVGAWESAAATATRSPAAAGRYECAAPVVARQGWRVGTLSPGESLATTWDDLGRSVTAQPTSYGATAPASVP